MYTSWCSQYRRIFLNFNINTKHLLHLLVVCYHYNSQSRITWAIACADIAAGLYLKQKISMGEPSRDEYYHTIYVSICSRTNIDSIFKPLDGLITLLLELTCQQINRNSWTEGNENIQSTYFINLHDQIWEILNDFQH